MTITKKRFYSYLVPSHLIAALPTDSGMHALWDSTSFSHICDYDDWEKEILDNADIERHISNGAFVPIYVHSDGTPSIELRVGNISQVEYIKERERPWVVVKLSLIYLSQKVGGPWWFIILKRLTFLVQRMTSIRQAF